MASYNKFNYSFRPAKAVERKLLIEILKEIYGVIDARHCTYIGFGSIFFVDFKMIHKELGIKSMVNIESNTEDEERFKYNKPFSCIDLVWGTSTERLPELDWVGKKIIWMDYDETLQPYMFDDVEIIFSKLEPGSFFFLTCNSTLPKYRLPDGTGYNIQGFENDFPGLTPLHIEGEMLTNNQVPFLVRNMLLTQINHVINLRNGILEDADKLMFCQLLFITYKDNAPMCSLGGMVVKRSEYNNLKNAGIFSLPYVRTGDEKFDIQSPVLTNSEIDLINSHLPKSKARFMSLRRMGFIPAEDREKYYHVYRYYPSYVEARD